MRPGTLLLAILFFVSAREAYGQKREFSSSLYYGEGYVAGQGFAFLPPISKWNPTFALAASVHYSFKPVGQPFRLKVGNQLAFRQLSDGQNNIGFILLDRIPVDVELRFGKRVSFSVEGGFYGSFLIGIDAPETSDIYRTNRWAHFGAHLKLSMAGQISKNTSLGLSIHHYKDLSPLYFSPRHFIRYSNEEPNYGFDSYLSLDYTVRFE
ncbi:MAG TPA: hypothetical protein DIW47_13270 [Bacteroidetes bacterium]|nr:hypothetical protein [Bacteroidota bacterium]